MATCRERSEAIQSNAVKAGDIPKTQKVGQNPEMAGDAEICITTYRHCSVPLSMVSNKHGKLIAHDNHRELSWTCHATAGVDQRKDGRVRGSTVAHLQKILRGHYLGGRNKCKGSNGSPALL